MIANFFRNLEADRVEYLLISGQATVLYGAAFFSEDIDVWLNPDERNVKRFIGVLRKHQARYYKLTPPLTVECLRRRHGFHFVLSGVARDEVFLDVMGVPPRVGTFKAALADSQLLESEWGRVATVSIPHLIELKKTQRLEDYPIISKLVLRWFSTSNEKVSDRHHRWAFENLFTISSLKEFLEQQPDSVRVLPKSDRMGLRAFARHVALHQEPTDLVTDLVEKWMQAKMRRLQALDRRYWRRVIADLKLLRATGKLMPEDSLV